MATINTELPTLLDQMKRLDPNGAIAHIVELLQRKNAILEDAVFMEGNLPTGHRFTSRTALPAVGWRRLNEGITPGKSATEQVDEATGMLEGMSVVDVDLAKLGGNEAAFRASEDKGFIQSLSNEAETALFYASTATAPETIQGLTPRLNSLSGRAKSQIIPVDAGAAGNDQASIWLVVWGPESVFGIYPKGSQGGLNSKDMGEQLWDDGVGRKFRAYVSHWQWKLGLVVKDYRQIVRMPNIDTSALDGTADTIIPAMIRGYSQIHDLRAGRPVFYVSRTVETYLWLQARNAVKNSTLAVREVEGRPVLTFMGIPVRRADALLTTESVVS